MTQKQLIKEAFNLKTIELNGTKGNKYKVVCVDTKNSENTYAYQDIFKAHKAKWLANIKSWGWIIGGDPQTVLQNYVYPCLAELTKVEDGGQGTRQGQEMQVINELLAELQTGKVESIEIPNARKVSDALIQFKADLIKCVSSEEFKKKMEPIAKFAAAQGWQVSLKNSILILMQDPQATMVKSETMWGKMNRIVVDKSVPVVMFRPDNEPLSTGEKNAIRRKFLADCGVNSIEELNPGQKEQLDVKLRGGKLKQNADGRPIYKTYYGYDVRFTQVMDGKEDLVGSNSGRDDIDWYDKSTEESEEFQVFIKATMEVTQAAGIKIETVPEGSLGGALGVAVSDGTIKVAGKAVNTKNFLDTMIHESCHHWLHLSYIKKSKNEEWAQYFVGSPQGRKHVEIQAEIAAWLIMKAFGVETNTSINYGGLYGMDDKVAARVCDELMNVSTYFIKRIQAQVHNNKHVSFEDIYDED